MAEKKESKYQRCDECHGSYLIVFECRDGKKRCARCKEKFDRQEEGNERGKGDKRGIGYLSRTLNSRYCTFR